MRLSYLLCPKQKNNTHPMRVHCTNCGRDGHAKWQCTRPTKSTAVRKADVRRLSPGERDREPDCVVTPAGSSALPVDTHNPSSRKGSGVESLRTPTEGRKGRDSTSGGARAKLRDPSAVLTQTAAQPPVGTNSRHTNLARSAHKGENPRHADGGKPLTQTRPAKFNKTAYQREYMARYRSEIKSGKRVPKRKGE